MLRLWFLIGMYQNIFSEHWNGGLAKKEGIKLAVKFSGLSSFTACFVCFWFGAAAQAEERMHVVGDTLVFNTDDFLRSETEESTIIAEDENLFGDLIMNNPNIHTVILTGTGGSTRAAEGISRKIIEFGLETVARDRCISSCSTIFLAGIERTLEKGGRVCFHRARATAQSYRELYEKNRKAESWTDPFDFAEVAFDFGQRSARDYVDFAVSQGVTLEFALKTLTYSSNDMWCPTREQLVEAGVLPDPDQLPTP